MPLTAEEIAELISIHAPHEGSDASIIKKYGI